MPLTEKGEKIKAEMQKEYGKEKGERVFYASKNAGRISGVDRAAATRKAGRHRRGDADVGPSDDITPERKKDLLGEPSLPETTPRGPIIKKVILVPRNTGAPMNNLGMGIPAPGNDQSSTFVGTTPTSMPSSPTVNISSQPSSAAATTTSPTTTGDAIRSMNTRNRDFWERRRR